MPPTYCPCNKPILKRRPTHDVHAPPSDDLLHIDPSVLGHPTVHFPPHATLVTRTFLAHPRDEYDRSPIVVVPNACRLPERGCPGRTYRADSPSPVSPRRRPRSPATRRTHGHGSSASVLPPLVPDLTSSSSDESDGCLPVHVGTVPHTDFYNTGNSNKMKTSSLVCTTSTDPDVDSIRYTNTSIPTIPITSSSGLIPTTQASIGSSPSHTISAHTVSAQSQSHIIPSASPSHTLSTPTPTLHTPTPTLPTPTQSLPTQTFHTTLPPTLTLSDSPPPAPSPLSNPTSPVSFTVRSTTSALVSLSPRRERSSRWERGVGGRRGERERERESRERGGLSLSASSSASSSAYASSAQSSSSSSLMGGIGMSGVGVKVRRREREREGEKGFKRFGEFGEGRGVLSGCALRVDDGGCFGGF